MASPASVKKWDGEADVIVAGSGLAGCAAAIAAHDGDTKADVLMIEKMPEALRGGNSRVSGQSLLISKNIEALIAYQRAMSTVNPIPEDMLRSWAEQMVGLEPYIEERAKEAGARYIHGVGWSAAKAVLEFPSLGAAAAVEHTATILPVPSGVWLAFDKCVALRPRIRRMFDSPIVDLVQDPDTLEVFGVIVEQGGVRRALRARRGVVMATGGFENNLAMQRDYEGLQHAQPPGTPANTGEPIKILQKAGADMWHLRNRGQSAGLWPAFRFPGRDTAFQRNLFFQTFSWLDLAGDDTRFGNETAEWRLTHYKENAHGEWIDTPHHRVGRMHMIFDEVTRQSTCLVMKIMTWNSIVEGYEWSDDNAAELAAGWITSADSIEALATKLGRDPARVAETVREYNAACAAGHDARFGRNPQTLQPIAKGPFYAIEVIPGIVCTGDGARRNIESEVLDHDGRPIRRLYEAGELGSMFSDLYQNGSYFTEAMISGRAAGRNAVRLTEWAD